MSELPAANDKLREADFFYCFMERAFDRYEFKYFVSAFLSALQSSTEHNRLQSTDPRFKDWYREAKSKYIDDPLLRQLFDLRNREIHHKGTQAVQQAGMSFEEPLETTHLEFTVDFSKGKPVGTYKTAEMAEAKPYDVTQKWVWKTTDEPEVMDLCQKGLDIVRALIGGRDVMNFPD